MRAQEYPSRPYYSPTVRRLEQSGVDSLNLLSKHSTKTDLSTEWQSSTRQLSRGMDNEGLEGELDISDSNFTSKSRIGINCANGLAVLGTLFTRRRTVYACAFFSGFKRICMEHIHSEQICCLKTIILPLFQLKVVQYRRQAFYRLKRELTRAKHRQNVLSRGIQILADKVNNCFTLAFKKMIKLSFACKKWLPSNCGAYNKPLGETPMRPFLQPHQQQKSPYDWSATEVADSSIEYLSEGFSCISDKSLKTRADFAMHRSPPINQHFAQATGPSICTTSLQQPKLYCRDGSNARPSSSLKPIPKNQNTLSKNCRTAKSPELQKQQSTDCIAHDEYQLIAVLTGTLPSHKTPIHSADQLRGWFNKHRRTKPKPSVNSRSRSRNTRS